jgi:hypothetical protein
LWLHKHLQERVAQPEIRLVNPYAFRYTIAYQATSPSGKARVCKTLIVGSIPTVASFLKRRSRAWTGVLFCGSGYIAGLQD